MIAPGLSAAIFGLISAISWGAGDFCGGLATRRFNVYRVVILSQLTGALMLLAIALIIRDPLPSTRDLFYGAIAGVSGAFGVMALYQALASGRMGVAAPLSALFTVTIPLVFGFFLEGLPGHPQLIGFVFALIAVGLISMEEGGQRTRLGDLKLPLAAGLGFGLFFVLIGQVSEGTVFWPLVSARVFSLLFLVAISLIVKGAAQTGGEPMPLKLILLAGIFDSGGNIFYTLATQLGRLDVAAVLASLYPGVTVMLSWGILKESLSKRQWLGVLAAILAVILISV